MDYLGLYKLSRIHTIVPDGESFKTAWVTPEEYIATSTDDHDRMEREQVCGTKIRVDADGNIYNLIPIPAGVTEEQIQAAVEAEGLTVVDGKYILDQDTTPWEMREDGFYTKSGSGGTILDTECDPWIKSGCEDGTLLLGDIVQTEYIKE